MDCKAFRDAAGEEYLLLKKRAQYLKFYNFSSQGLANIMHNPECVKIEMTDDFWMGHNFKIDTHQTSLESE